MKYFTAFIVLFSINIGIAQNILIDENYTPQQLVQDILINSGCASITNVTVSGANYSNGDKSFGYFNRNGSIFAIDEGVILSTGKVANAPGPNNSLLSDGGDISWPGDNDLNSALGVSNTFNATVLEFDFIPQGNKISFDFQLSSEQYLSNPSSNQCNYTDGFAFLLREVGTTTYQNLALIPGTNTPIKINTVRGSGTVCPAANSQYFDAFNGSTYPTNFNGQTVVFTAQSTVVPNTQYHIKLVVADQGNHQYDSAIFLKAGSFNTNANLGDDRTVANGNPLCNNELPYRLETNSAGSHKWFLNGNEISGETNSFLDINQGGTYSVEITIPGCTPSPTDEIVIEIAPNLIQSTTTTFTECDIIGAQDGISSFDLNSIIPQIFTNLPVNFQVGLFESPTSTTALSSSYQNTIPYQQTLYAKIINIAGCYDTVSFPITLVVNTFDETVTNESIAICENNPVVLDAGFGFSSYTWNTNPIQNSQTITVSNSGSYIVTLENALGCTKTKTFTVSSSEIATSVQVIVADFSENNTATVLITGNGTYEFSLDNNTYQDSNVFSNLSAGKYTAYVKNECGINDATFYILDYPKYFTPNGDGINDTWQITNLDKSDLSNSKIYVFDRYGKLVKQISPSGPGWNGTYNGNLLPSDDYWFALELSNGRRITNHFTLKR